MGLFGLWKTPEDLDRWRRQDEGVAYALEAGKDEIGDASNEFLILPGQGALLEVEGKPEGELPPGKHTIKKAATFFRSKLPSHLRIIFYHRGDLALSFAFPDLKTEEGTQVEARLRVSVIVRDASRLRQNGLGNARKHLTAPDLSEDLAEDVRRVVQDFVGTHTREGMPGPGQLSLALEGPLEDGMREPLERMGLRFVRLVSAQVVDHEWAEVIRGRADVEKSTALEAIKKAEKDLEHRVFSEDTLREVERLAKEGEREKALSELDKDRIMRSADREALLRQIEATGAEELLASDQKLDELKQDFRIRSERGRVGWELEESRLRYDEDMRREGERMALDRQKAQLHIDIASEELDLKRREGMVGVELEKAKDDVHLSKLDRMMRMKEEKKAAKVARQKELLAMGSEGAILAANGDPNALDALNEMQKTKAATEITDHRIAGALLARGDEHAASVGVAQANADGEAQHAKGKLEGVEAGNAQAMDIAKQAMDRIAGVAEEAVRKPGVTNVMGGACCKSPSIMPGGKFCSTCGAKVA